MPELRNIDERLLSQWFELKKFEMELREIVEELRKHPDIKPIVGRRQIKEDVGEWVGVYGKNNFWAGFGIFNKEPTPEIVLWVEITLPDDSTQSPNDLDPELRDAFETAKHYLNLLQDDNALNCGTTGEKNARLVFVKQLTGELNGNGDAVLGWLCKISKMAVNLVERYIKPNEF